MAGNVADPEDARGFEHGVSVEAAGDGAVDDSLLLLPEQRDQLPLRPDEPVNLTVRMVQKPHDRRLLVRGRNENGKPSDFALVQILAKAGAVAIDGFSQVEYIENLVAVIGRDRLARFKAQ